MRTFLPANKGNLRALAMFAHISATTRRAGSWRGYRRPQTELHALAPLRKEPTVAVGPARSPSALRKTTLPGGIPSSSSNHRAALRTCQVGLGRRSSPTFFQSVFFISHLSSRVSRNFTREIVNEGQRSCGPPRRSLIAGHDRREDFGAGALNAVQRIGQRSCVSAGQVNVIGRTRRLHADRFADDVGNGLSLRLANPPRSILSPRLPVQERVRRLMR